MKYQLFRVLLTSREQPPLLKAAGDIEEITRTEFLLRLFQSDWEFSGARGTRYSYVFAHSLEKFVVARIGRLKTAIVHDGPETKFAEAEQSVWHPINFLMDVSDHPDGQKVALEVDNEVGTPLSVMRGLVERMNESNPRSPWEASVYPITRQSEFWEVVEQSRGRITTLELVFTAPNIFRGSDETTKELRRLHDENNAHKVSAKLINKDGHLDPDSVSIRENIDYIAKGGGSAKLKAGKTVIYDSEEQDETVDVPDDFETDAAPDSPNGWLKLIVSIFKS